MIFAEAFKTLNCRNKTNLIKIEIKTNICNKIFDEKKFEFQSRQ